MYVYTLGKTCQTYNLALIKLEVDEKYIKCYANHVVNKAYAEYQLKKNSQAKIISIIDQKLKNYLIGYAPLNGILYKIQINDTINNAVVVYLTAARALSNIYVEKNFTGKSNTYYDSGETESEINYLNGKKHGSAIYYNIIYNLIIHIIFFEFTM